MTPHDPIPQFEGRPVDHTMVKVRGAVPLDDLNDVVLGMDDCVQMISTFRVVGVDHTVDEKTGNLVRLQTLKPVEMALHPFDANDPNDEGIIRSLPQAVMGALEGGEDR